MTKTNKPQRTIRIAKALGKMREVARAEVAKREVLHFRVDKTSILEIYEAAARKKKPVGTMVREWVLECLHEEQEGRAGTNLRSIEQRLKALEKRIAKKA